METSIPEVRQEVVALPALFLILEWVVAVHLVQEERRKLPVRLATAESALGVVDPEAVPES